MKLIFAVIHDEDGQKVIRELNVKGFSVTKLCSTGGFLKSGNTTLLVGTERDKVDTVINIIKKNSKSRKQTFNSYIPVNGMNGILNPYSHEDESYNTPIDSNEAESLYTSYPTDVIVGGATIFVLDVERYEKF